MIKTCRVCGAAARPSPFGPVHLDPLGMMRLSYTEYNAVLADRNTLGHGHARQYDQIHHAEIVGRDGGAVGDQGAEAAAPEALPLPSTEGTE